jgi:uncharacterized membrane protein
MDKPMNIFHRLSGKLPNTVVANRIMIAPIAVFIMVIVLRFYDLGEESFWVDEIGHIEAASQENIGSVLEYVKIHYGAAPLDYVFLNIYLKATNFINEAEIRLLYVGYGAISFVVFYYLARIIYGHSIAILSSIAYGVSPFLIQYSQEIRFYALAVLLSLLSMILFIHAIRNNERRIWGIWTFINLLGLYNFYFHAFIIAFQLLYFLDHAIRENALNHGELKHFTKQYVIPLVLSLIVISAAFLPWFFWDNQIGNPYSDNPVPVNLRGTIQGLAERFGGPSIFLVLIVAAFIGGLAVMEVRLFLILFIGSIFGAVLFDYLFGYFFVDRQIVHVYPYFLLSIFGAPRLLAKLNIDISRRRFFALLRNSILPIFLAIMVIFPSISQLVIYFRDYQKPNWRGTISYFQSQSISDDDVVLVFSRQEQKSLLFYFERMVQTRIPEVKFIENSERLDISLANPERVWIVFTPFWAWLMQPELVDWFSWNSQETIVIGNVIVLPLHSDT